MERDFLQKIASILEQHLSDERFGVSELAAAAGMSRSNLLRKIKKITGLSASRYMRQLRLEQAMEILKKEDLTVSEIAYRVGFNSPSYFIKCFREHYGYPPGDAGKQMDQDTSGEAASGKLPPGNFRKAWKLTGYAVLVLALLLMSLQIFIRKGRGPGGIGSGKSIAVLPFKNDSHDSTNVYFINGLMESVLDNLQKIEDLRVISRTSVEKYRTQTRSVPEIARELNVNYLVEGSGQKVGDRIQLTIQLIDAASDRHLWSETYRRELGDVFDLQLEIARKISSEIEAVITPEEAARIEKAPTENLLAYDLFLQGLDRFYEGTGEGLEAAVDLFGKAVEEDPGFARAWADMAICLTILDMYRVDKKYTDEIGRLAARAMELDPTLAQSLVAMAMYHITRKEYPQALPYLEEALEYHPNSSMVINILSDFYTRHIPDTQKYLEYALKGVELDIASHDAQEAGSIYLHLGNAFIQTGFITQAEKYIALSLNLVPGNKYAQLLWAYIQLAGDRDLQQTRQRLEMLLEPDTLQHDILKELGVISYFQRDFEAAHDYFTRMFKLAEAQGLDLYNGEKIKMALVASELGRQEESAEYLREYYAYARDTPSVYKHLSLSAYYAFTGDTERTLEHFALFAEQEKYPYWYILFLDMDDPLFDPVEDLPEFQALLQEIKVKFWAYHQGIRDSLKESGLL